MLKIGLTGGIGSGKTTVSKIFSLLGIPVYDADSAAKRIMTTNKRLITNLKKEFGENIYNSKNQLNKKVLANIAFNNMKSLKKLNSLVHPEVKKDFDTWTKKHATFPYVIEEAAILFESGANKDMDYVIMVSAPEEIRFRRVMRRDGTDKDHIKKIAGNQMSEEEKKQQADFVIVNDGQQMVIPQILDLHNHFLSLILNKK